MNAYEKCLIDNWSLEQAAILLDGGDQASYLSNESFINSLGGLSNFINALLLYDETKFVANGLEMNWFRYEWFNKNSLIYMNPYIPTEEYLKWENHLSSSDFGAYTYVFTSQFLKSDLFLSPERAKTIVDNKSLIQNNFLNVLKKVDEKIKVENRLLFDNNGSWLFSDLKLGVEQNFILPSFTQFIFSQASSSEDLLSIIIELKESRRIDRIKEDIAQLLVNIKKSSELQYEIENIISSHFGSEINKKCKSFSLELNVLFLTISKKFYFDIKSKGTYLIFLKDIIACRTEAFSLKKDIERIFKRKIDINK